MESINLLRNSGQQCRKMCFRVTPPKRWGSWDLYTPIISQQSLVEGSSSEGINSLALRPERWAGKVGFSKQRNPSGRCRCWLLEGGLAPEVVRWGHRGDSLGCALIGMRTLLPAKGSLSLLEWRAKLLIFHWRMKGSKINAFSSVIKVKLTYNKLHIWRCAAGWIGTCI